MANKVETTIAYRLDARGLRDAKRELERSFKPESVKALNAALKDARSRVKDLSQEYSRAAKAQGAMANLPKQLRANLKAARDEVQKLTGDLKHQLDIERKLAELHEKERQQAKADRATAFRQGALQGLGGPLSSFLQRREAATTEQQRAELWAQFKGQMVGGAARRAVGGVRTGIGMASAMTSGAGPMGTLLGNVPFLGGAAQLAEGAVGTFVERQRALLGALPYVGGVEGLHGARAAAGASAVRAGRGRIEAVGLAAAERTFAGGGEREKALEADTQGMLDRGMIPKTFIDENPHLRRNGKMNEVFSGLPLDTRRDYVRRSLEETAGTRLAETGRDASTAQKSAMDAERKKIAAEAERKAINAPFAGMKAAVHGLLTDTEAIQAGTQFTRQVGGRYNQGQFEQAFAAETQFGVDQSTSAQLFRQQRAGRGGTTKDATNMLAKAIGAATAQGLEGSEIGEYLDSIASAQATAEQRGLKIDTESLTGLGVGLSRGLGLEGPQAGRVASNITQMAQNVVTQGAKGPIDIQMLRAAGFDPEKGNFLETRRKLAGGMDASSTFDLLEGLVGGEGDPLKRGYTLERAGLGLGTEQAITVAELLKKGKGAFMESIGTGTGSAADLLGQMAMKDAQGKPTTLGAITGGIRGANAVQNQMVAAGGAAADNVLKLQLQAAELATTLTTAFKGPMTTISNNIVKLSKGIEDLANMLAQWGGEGAIPVKMR